jgi:hypothetical protein
VQKVAFFHGLQPWAHNLILQRSEILVACQEMMKVINCMEDDSMHEKVGMSQVSQLTMKMSIRSATQTASGPRRGQKRKWDENPPKDKRASIEKKKLQDVTKVQYFNYKELGHFAKDCKKVKQDWT